MANPKRSAPGKSSKRSKSPKSTHSMQDELVRKLPSQVEPAQEWGERLSTGKAIATGGKSGITRRAVSKKRTPRKRGSGT